MLVAPLAGAWIETLLNLLFAAYESVAPLAGAWIETFICFMDILSMPRRSPRGSVD